MSRVLVLGPALLALGSLALVSCREVACPDGQVAVEGKCFSAAEVAALDGGAPKRCSECSGATPFCDMASGTCVGCRADADCAGTASPTCDPGSHACVGCLADDDCTESTTPVCDTTTRACTGCATDAQCERFDMVCETTSHACVQCTRATEATACGGTSCNVATSRCTTTPVGTQSRCGTCANDSECSEGTRCVAYRWHDGDRVENVCLPAPINGSCATTNVSLLSPYFLPLTTTTLWGDATTVCAPPSTCFSTLAYIRRAPCMFPDDCTNNVMYAGTCIANDPSGVKRCSMWCASYGEQPNYIDACGAGDVCGALFCRSPD